MKYVMMSVVILVALFSLASPGISRAEVRTQEVPYEQGGARLVGYLAYDGAVTSPRPAVLVVHEWWGLNDYTKRRTRQLAELGYIAFAADIYGDGTVTKDPKEAGALAGRFRGGDRSLLRERVGAGLEALLNNPLADRKQ